MHLDHQAVRACGNSSLGQRLDHPVDTACMARVNNDRQVAHALEHRHSGDVQRVAGVLLIGADTALAQDNVLISACHDVLGGHQEFLHGVGEAALEQDRLIRLAQLLEQLKVLHVARADLEAVALVHEQVDVCGISDFSDNRHPGYLVRLVQQFEALGLKALEGVRGRTGLPCAAAQDCRAVRLHMFGNVDDLLLALDRAGAGHHDQLFAAHDNARRDFDLRVVRMELAVCQLERLLYLEDVFDLRVAQQRVLVDRAGVADQADDDRTRTVNRVCLDVPALDMPGQLFDMLAGRALFHNDDHSFSLLWIMGVDLRLSGGEKA